MTRDDGVEFRDAGAVCKEGGHSAMSRGILTSVEVCAGTTKNGWRCGHLPSKGDIYCWRHKHQGIKR